MFMYCIRISWKLNKWYIYIYMHISIYAYSQCLGWDMLIGELRLWQHFNRFFGIGCRPKLEGCPLNPWLSPGVCFAASTTVGGKPTEDARGPSGGGVSWVFAQMSNTDQYDNMLTYDARRDKPLHPSAIFGWPDVKRGNQS
jgi:hypothetical protein